MDKQKRISPDAPLTAAGMVESIVGCKWSLTVLHLVRQGVLRPGAMEHAVPGLSAKVLNERLRKLTRYGILGKQSYPEIPPRVEYRLTEFGSKFAALLDNIRSLQDDLDRGALGRHSRAIGRDAQGMCEADA